MISTVHINDSTLSLAGSRDPINVNCDTTEEDLGHVSEAAAPELSLQRPLKASRRGTASTTISSSSSKDEEECNVTTTPPRNSERKAHRRVSFTTATTMEEPPTCVVIVDDSADNGTTDQADFVVSCQSLSPSTNNNKRRSTPNSLQSTPHHSNLNHHHYTSPLTTQSFLNSSRATIITPLRAGNPTTTTTIITPMTYSCNSRRSSLAGSSRRSSLDSCSSYASSAVSSQSCYSFTGTASLASVLSLRDETFQRRKLLSCLEWLSHHMSRHLVQQLMLEVQQYEQEEEQHQRQVNTPRRRSTSSAIIRQVGLKKKATLQSDSVATPRRHSLPELSYQTSKSRGPSTSPITNTRSTKLSVPPNLPRCSYVRYETPSSSFVSSDEEKRRQKRLLKTQESLDRLSFQGQGCISSSEEDEDDNEDSAAMMALGYESTTSATVDLHLKADQPRHISPSTRQLQQQLPAPQQHHQTALLLVDISGFTALSQTLSLQALSQTINTYFQRIIECIEEYGGDVVKFAGDAVMVEWRSLQQSNHDDYNSESISKQLFAGTAVTANDEHEDPTEPVIHVVQIATACACQIVERCSDYHVYDQDVVLGKQSFAKEDNRLLATLNVHCGVGYGDMVGFHAGDETRREYLLLGDPIAKAADAIALGRGGEVVASPEAMEILVGSSSQQQSQEEETINKAAQPQVVFSSRLDRFETTPNLLDREKLLIPPPKANVNRPNLTNALESWDLPSLKRLQELMALYVHSTVIEGEMFTTIYHNHHAAAAASTSFDSDLNSSLPSQHEQERLEHDQFLHQSEAEIRRVFTLFLQPLVSVDITGDPVHDETVMTTLNEIMLLANRELARFKGHLRQFIVDDKGVVLIANFGLRGSMLPRMIENQAMPFAASLQSVLKSELGVECRMGGTYGNCYCGVVGGLQRHEFSILGPAVNLSARLMGNPENHGFLVEEEVRAEAHGWQFNAREPVPAKGYTSHVPIFEPVTHTRSAWARHAGFVGREEEINLIMENTGDIVSSECSSGGKMVLVSGASGFGKTSLLAESADRIQQHCQKQRRSHLILGQVCCDDDLFRPMSVLGPVVLDALRKTGNPSSQSASGDDQTGAAIQIVPSPVGTSFFDHFAAKTVELLHATCESAGVSEEHVPVIQSLLFDHEWPERELWQHKESEMQSSQCSSYTKQNEIARSLVSILLQTTVSVDLVLLCIDDISLMDEFSWRVLQLWFEHACNLMIIGTSNRVICRDFNIPQGFWDYLFSTGMLLNRFLHVELPPMTESDVQRLVAVAKGHATCTDSKTAISPTSAELEFVHETYIQSGGNPRLAMSMIKRFAGEVHVDTSKKASDELSSTQEGAKVVASANASDTLAFNDHMLHRIDAVPSVVRTHLNLCAMLGDSFCIKDVALVMERYRGVEAQDREEHAELVHDALNDAVWHDILAIEGELVQHDATETFPQKFPTGVVRYRFTHSLWREKILELTLDSWQRDMQLLINESLRVGNEGL